MANLIFRKMPYFDHTQKNWSLYQNQLEEFLIANEIKDATKKKAILLTSYIHNWPLQPFSQDY